MKAKLKIVEIVEEVTKVKTCFELYYLSMNYTQLNIKVQFVYLPMEEFINSAIYLFINNNLLLLCQLDIKG